MKHKLVLFAALAVCAAPSLVNAQYTPIVTWSLANGSTPTQSMLYGGPWTLSQGEPETTYCTSGGTGTPIMNPSTTVNTMNPFYFPFVTGSGNNLQGYFDYRPDATNEAIMAANSTDGGLTWHFQQMVASLSPDCPSANPPAGNDAGQGHAHTISFLGATWMYTLDRRNYYVDNAGLIVQRLTPNIPGGQPLKPNPAYTTFTPPGEFSGSPTLASGAVLFAGWDFNADSNTSVTINGNKYNQNNSPATSIGPVGVGTATVLGMMTNYQYAPNGSNQTVGLVGSVPSADVTSESGSTDPNSDFNSLAWRVRGPACTQSETVCGTGVANGWNLAAPQYTQGAEFDVNTSTYYHVVVQYDWGVTGQGIRTLQAQCNANVSNPNTWMNAGPVQTTIDGGGFINQITLDFTALGLNTSATCMADNNPNFGIRMVSVYDPSYTGAGAPTYTGATLTNGQPTVYNNDSGNWQFDEVNFFGNTASTTTTSPISAVTPTRTTGLIDPDGILAVVPGTYPVKVLYVSKQVEGDYTFPSAQQCNAPPVVTPNYPYMLSANHDVSTVRLATTSNGVNFTDLGPVTGLNDSTTVSYVGIRYVSPNGGLIALPNGNWGLFFGAGNCIDADSDSFHAIAYAESSNLTNWNIVNGINNPILSRPTATFLDQATNTNLTIPATAPVAGTTQSWFAGRVYAPNAIVNSQNNGVSLIVDGYNTGYAAKKSNNPGKMTKDLSSYRNVGQVSLSSGGVVVH